MCVLCVDGSNQGPSSAACNTVATLTPSICTILDQEMVAVLERLLNERENFDLYRLEMDQRVKRITEELVRKDEVVQALGRRVEREEQLHGTTKQKLE